MKKIQLNNNAVARYGTEALAFFQASTHLFAKTPTKITASPSQRFIEISLPLHVGAYALLGYCFTPDLSGTLSIDISVSDQRIPFTQSFTIEKEPLLGIPAEYAQLILNKFTKYFKNTDAPQGHLNICMGAYSEIYSSPIIFDIASDILIEMFIAKNIEQTYMIELCNTKLLKRYT